MRADYSAVPRLITPDVVDGEGDSLDAQSWAALIDTLRPRFDTLSYLELCRLLRESYFTDLISLVISTPYSEAMLNRLRAGLSEPLWAELKKDCERYGNSLLGADLAAGSFKRIDATLTKFMDKRATPEQLAQLTTLAQQITTLDDAGVKHCLDGFESILLPHLVLLTGGLEGSLAPRVQCNSSEKGWAYFLENYADDIAEPASRADVEIAITGLPALTAGQPWPHPSKYLSHEETQAFLDEMEDSLDTHERQMNEGTEVPKTEAQIMAIGEKGFIRQPRVITFLVITFVFYTVWLGILFIADAIDNVVLLLTPLAPVAVRILIMRLRWERMKP